MQLLSGLACCVPRVAERLFISKCLLAMRSDPAEREESYRPINKTIVIAMKLTIILLTAAVLQVSARGYAQSVTLSVKNASLQKVFSEIERQTGYYFTYTREQLKDTKPVSIEVVNASLTAILDECMKGQPVSYQVISKMIIIKTAEAKKIPAAVDELPPFIDIKGRVTNEKGEPVEGVSVLVKGTGNGTITNKNGLFELKAVDEQATLLITGVSIESREMKIPGNIFLTIIARIKINQEEEVTVNAGYYRVRRPEATGSIGKVSSQTIEKQPVLNPMAAIQGRITGAFIQQTTGIPGGDFKIEIRGRNSLRDDGNAPLYVIDGVPFSSEKASSGVTTGGILGTGANPLNGINNADIESIEILKDADATAIYGSRGANGVILITTKKGKTGKTRLTMDVYTGGGKTPAVKLVNTKQYLALRREAFANDGLIPTADPDDRGQNGKGYAPDLVLWDTTRYTDWQKTLIGETAKSTSIQATLTGGSEGTQFLFSAGYRKETTVFPADFAFTKASSHFTLNHRSPDKRFTLSLAMTGTADRNTNTIIDFANRSRVYAPNAPAIYNSDGSYNWENSTWENPMPNLRNRTYTNNTSTFISNAITAYEILPGLELKSSFGFTQVQSREKRTWPSTAFDPALGMTSKNSNVTSARGTNNSWIIEPQINYEKKIGPGHLAVLVGASFQEQRLDRKADSYTDFPSNSFLDNLATANEKTMVEFITSVYRYAAVFGRLNYSIDKKYILNITGRRDGSSRFGTGRQFAHFGAAGAAWIFSKEKWMEAYASFISFGKIRASYGTTGSDQIGNYMYLDTYIAGAGNTSQYDGVTGLNPSRLFNANYGWEINRKMEAALELGFFKDRINITAAYYRNRSGNQLIQYALPVTTGFNGILSNFPATVQNTGVELELNTVNVKNKNVKWTSSFNITIPENKLVEFPNIESSTYANRYIVGQSIYLRKVYEYTGVDATTGLYSFKDYNGDGKLTNPEDTRVAVLINQQLYGGFNNSVTYKNWSLDIFFQFVKQQGDDYMGGIPGFPFSPPAAFLEKKRWQKPGDIAQEQRLMTEYNPLTNGGFVTDFLLQSNASVGDASYIRCKNISLAYQFPQTWIKGWSGRVYVQAQNLFVITGYESFDPESQAVRVAPLKMLTAGIQVNL